MKRHRFSCTSSTLVFLSWCIIFLDNTPLADIMQVGRYGDFMSFLDWSFVDLVVSLSFVKGTALLGLRCGLRGGI